MSERNFWEFIKDEIERTREPMRHLERPGDHVERIRKWILKNRRLFTPDQRKKLLAGLA